MNSKRYENKNEKRKLNLDFPSAFKIPPRKQTVIKQKKEKKKTMKELGNQRKHRTYMMMKAIFLVNTRPTSSEQTRKT